MICSQCSTVNPDIYTFCGMCGARIESRTPVMVLPEQAERLSRPSSTSISGPSFLGLADSDSQAEDYLLEDQPSRGRRGWFLFTFLSLAILVGIGVVEWQALRGSLFPPPADSSEIPPSPSPELPISSLKIAPSWEPWGAISLPQSEQGTEEMKADLQATQESTSRQAREASNRKSELAPADDSKDEKSEQPEEPTSRSGLLPNRMLVLGEKYLYGRGVAPNCPQAVVYFKAAAQEKNATAMLHLGAIYASGQCVPQDRMLAYSWFRRAQESDPENPWIARNMNMVLRDMTTQERAALRR